MVLLTLNGSLPNLFIMHTDNFYIDLARQREGKGWGFFVFLFRLPRFTIVVNPVPVTECGY